jgi:hypothetical protein
VEGAWEDQPTKKLVAGMTQWYHSMDAVCGDDVVLAWVMKLLEY